MSQSVIVGPPGTGKTTKLISLVEEYLSKGTKPNQIAYLSFTVKAATEAKTRALEKFKFESNDLPWFRTLHSMAFKLLGLSTGDLMKKAHYSELCEKLGIEYSGYVVLDEGVMMAGALPGDRMLFHEGLQRVRQISTAEQYAMVDEDYSYAEYFRLVQALDKYKSAHALLDFNDMLALLLSHQHFPKLKVLIIDEAQDLSSLQWSVVRLLAQSAEDIYIAGDDDQSIFRWAGADTEAFINCPGTVIPLSKSYRLCPSVHALAARMIQHCRNRRPKVFSPSDHEGSVRYLSSIDELSLGDKDAGNWLILARNAYLLNPVEELCETSGFAYASKKSPLKDEVVIAIRTFEHFRKGNSITPEELGLIKKYAPGFDPSKQQPIWHEAFKRMGQDVKDYFIAALRRGESLTKDPRIKLSTIHGAKGGEADNVLLLTDMSYKSYEEYLAHPDDEVRTFYVGATRARKNLFILEGQTPNSFDLL